MVHQLCLEGLTKQSFNRTPQARAFCTPENARACGVRLNELAATNHFNVGVPLAIDQRFPIVDQGSFRFEREPVQIAVDLDVDGFVGEVRTNVGEDAALGTRA